MTTEQRYKRLPPEYREMVDIAMKAFPTMTRAHAVWDAERELLSKLKLSKKIGRRGSK